MNMKCVNILVSEELHALWPQFRGAAITATVKNSAYNQLLWNKIHEFTVLYCQEYTIDSIKDMPAIQATRQAYKKCGKDPSRYRPSAEALCRRILKGMGLYQIDTLVDLVNLASVYCGHSIGAFDLDKIRGEEIVLGIGKRDEPYEGIGRGSLNIEHMPVYRDKMGAFATPTSDNERTKIDLDTVHILVIINSYNGSQGLDASAAYLIQLLEQFAQATNVALKYFE